MQPKPNYLSFSKEWLLTQEVTPCDIYILINNKFKKIINQGTQRNDIELNLIDNEKVEDIYIVADDYMQSKEVFFPELVKEVLAEEEADKSERVLSIFEGFGFDKAYISKAITRVKGLNESFEKIKIDQLSELLNSNELGFTYTHSLLTAIVIFQVTEGLNWVDKSVEDEFIQACILHDIGFVSKEEALQEAKIGKKTRKLSKTPSTVVKHIEEIIGQLAAYDVPADVIQMITYHHEPVEAIKKLGKSRFSKKSEIFNLAHETAIIYLNNILKTDQVLWELDHLYNDYDIPELKITVKLFRDKILNRRD